MAAVEVHHLGYGVAPRTSSTESALMATTRLPRDEHAGDVGEVEPRGVVGIEGVELGEDASSRTVDSGVDLIHFLGVSSFQELKILCSTMLRLRDFGCEAQDSAVAGAVCGTAVRMVIAASSLTWKRRDGGDGFGAMRGTSRSRTRCLGRVGGELEVGLDICMAWPVPRCSAGGRTGAGGRGGGPDPVGFVPMIQ